jgi:hypothetical protein
MARRLTNVERYFIANHSHLTAEDIRKELKNEVTVGEINRFRKELNLEKENEPESVLKDKTPEEVKEIVSNDEITPGKLLGRRPGIVVMTEAASELSDAREVLRNKKVPGYFDKHSDKIHRIKKP